MKRIIKESQSKIIIERSKFISYSFNCDDKTQANDILQKVRENHHAANHVCFACVLKNKLETYFSDDGEPSGTAGAPILQVLKENDLICTLVIVVRYFGGIKLGVPGLFRAYKESAEECLKDNTKDVILKKLYTSTVDYATFSNIKKYFEKNSIDIFDVAFSNYVTFSVYLEENEYRNISSNIKLDYFGKEEYM